MPTNPSSIRRSTLLLLLAVLFAVWFSNLEYRKLVRPDEGRYAEIPREMVASGDWTTPRLNGVKYFEKPALQYWATAAAYSLFGEHHWTARLWPALTGFLGILMVGFTGARLFGNTAGLYAATVLASSLLYVLIGHLNTLDMGVSFFMGLGLCGFLLAHRPNVPARENRLWMLVTWASLAFSVLSKGLIGLVLPGAVLVLYTLIQRDWRLWTRLHLVTGLLLFFALSVPWFVAVSLANPEFFHFFFIHEHFERFLTKVHGRYQPWYYFVPILLMGMLPWVIPMFDALVRAWKSDGTRSFQPKRFLLLWSLFIYFFFSISDSKLPSYLLPIFPALALLIGERLTKLSGRALFWQISPLLILAVAALWLAPDVGRMGDEEVPPELYQHYVPWLMGAGGALLAGTLAALFWSRRSRVAPAVLALGLSGVVASQLILTGHESLSPASSAYHLVQRIKPYLKPGIPFYSVGMYEQTLPFYIKRTVTVVAWQDELEFGFQQEPDKWIPEMTTFKQRWRAEPQALAIMSPATYQQMEAEKLPMEIIARDTRRVVVRKP
jgi:4-amino-4-deoxy-L-arabinose transferase-like glycosyltransferase